MLFDEYKGTSSLDLIIIFLLKLRRITNMIHVHILSIPHRPMSYSLLSRNVSPITFGGTSHSSFLLLRHSLISIHTISNSSLSPRILSHPNKLIPNNPLLSRFSTHVTRGDHSGYGPVGLWFIPPDLSDELGSNTKVIK